MTVRFVPQGQPVLSPFLIVKGAAQAIAYYREVLGARLVYQLDMPDGRIGHSELRVGDSTFMVCDEFPEDGAFGPVPGSRRPPFTLSLYVEDVDAIAALAVERGGRLERPVQDQFYGDRTADLRDPFGHRWHLATHREDVSPEEMERRLAAGAEG